MNWQDLLNSLNASDDPQADAAGQGWKQLGNSAPVQQALDFSGNLKRADDDLGASAQSMKDMLHSGVASNPEADQRVAERSLASAMGTIKAAELTPNEKIRQLSQEYMKANKLPSLPDQPYAKVDTGVAKKIAQAYEDMKHDPENPDVKAAYKALIDETLGQFQKLKESGLKIDKITGENPYKSSADLFKDIKDNNHISYYPTDSGFGTEGSTSNHPLLAQSGEQINGEDVPANDIFRIVHDYFGHAKEGPGFGPRGEENAFREHAQMYSPEALKALATETRGQNSWVNYGPKGEANRANPANTTFAEQKAGLLPDWASEFNKTMETLKPELPMDEASRMARAKEMGFDPSKTYYHGTKADINEFDPNALGVSTNANSAKQGYFFASDPSTASDYAELSPARSVLRSKAETGQVDAYPEQVFNDLSKKIQVADNALQSHIQQSPDKLLRKVEQNKNLIKTFEEAKYMPSDLKKVRIDDLNNENDLITDKIKSIDKDSWTDKYNKLLQNFETKQKELDNYKDSSASGQNVIPVHLKTENPYIHDFQNSGYRDESYSDIMKKAKEAGHDSVIFKNTYDPADPNNRKLQDIIATFNPNQIRSKFAKFNPDDSDSGNIAAALGALGIGGAASQMDNQDKFSSLKKKLGL